MKKRYIIRLTEAEREHLTDLVHKGKAAAYRRNHAQVFLWADEGGSGPALMDREVAERVDINERTVSRLRQRCVAAHLRSNHAGH